MQRGAVLFRKWNAERGDAIGKLECKNRSGAFWEGGMQRWAVLIRMAKCRGAVRLGLVKCRGVVRLGIENRE